MPHLTDYFELVDQAGRTGSVAVVFLYPFDERVDENWVGPDGPVTEAARDALRQLYDFGAVDQYELFRLRPSAGYIATDDAVSDDDETKERFVEAFEDFTEAHPELYEYAGLHYGVGGTFDGGGGFSADELNELAFRTNLRMVIGTGSGDRDRVDAFTKQELGHGFMSYNYLRKTSALVETGGHPHEHDTGVVYPPGEVSPMAVTYHDTHARHGACGNGAVILDGYNPNYTVCTKLAVKRTANKIYEDAA